MKRCLFLLLCLSFLAPTLTAQSDPCAGAAGFPLIVGLNGPYSNVGFTSDGPATCGAGAHSDAWCEFIPAVTGAYSFSTCPVAAPPPPTNDDTILTVYDATGGCGALVALGCADDSGCGPSGFNSTLTPAACLTAGVSYYVRVSSWSGSPNGSWDMTVTAIAPPIPFAPDDECGGATPVGDGINPFPPLGVDGATYSNVGYTTSICVAAASCTGVAQDSDIWFSYVAGATAPITVSSCDPAGFATAGTNTDTILQIFDGTGGCGALVEVGCDDDSCGPSGFQSSAIAAATIGTTYYIRVGSWGTGSADGTFYLTIAACATPAPNDDCITALPVADGINPVPPAGLDGVMYDSTCATDSGLGVPICTFAGGNDVWFSYLALASGTLEVETCTPAGFAVFGSNTDTAVAIYDAAGGCAGLTSLGGDSSWEFGGATPCGNIAMARATHPVTLGGIYAIRVQNEAAAGTFYVTCTLSPTPGNDECVAATGVVAGANGPYDSTYASNSPGVAATCGVGGTPGFRDIWFSYTATCSSLTIDTCAPVGTNVDTLITVYTVCGGAEVACNDDACAPLVSSVSFASTPGTTYLIRVAGWGCNDYGTFTLNVTDPGGVFTLAGSNPPPPPGFATSIQVDWTNGPSLGTAALVPTATAGAFPFGWFYGIDPSIAEVAGALSDPAFNAFPLDACGNFTLGPFFLPAGFPFAFIPFYSVSLGMPAASTTPSVISNATVLTIM